MSKDWLTKKDLLKIGIISETTPDKEVEHRVRDLHRRKKGLKVYYGIGRVAGMRKKRSIEIYYENSRMTDRSEKVLKGAISEVVISRTQTSEENKEAYFANRVWTAHSYYIDEKPFNGSLERVLRGIYGGEGGRGYRSKSKRNYQGFTDCVVQALSEVC